jgi:hypothetical protein
MVVTGIETEARLYPSNGKLSSNAGRRDGMPRIAFMPALLLVG